MAIHSHSEQSSDGSWKTISSGRKLSPASDDKVNVDTSGGTVTVTLPSSPNDGTTWEIKRDGGNDVTVDTGGSENIDGSSSITLDADNESVRVSWDGDAGEYHIL